MSDIVISSQLFVKGPKKKGNKVGWLKQDFSLTSDGKLESGSTHFSLQQRTRIHHSEFREFCFAILTPRQKKLVLAASSEEEKAAWMKALEQACRRAPPTVVKVLLVGDDKAAQQQLLHAFFKECGRVKLANDVLKYSYKTDNSELAINLEVTGEKCKLVLFCVSAQDFSTLRTLNYVDANAFMICFSSDRISEFENIEKVWLPEIKPYVDKGASTFLVSIQQKREDDDVFPEEIDRLVTQEFAEYLNAPFYTINLDDSAGNKVIKNKAKKTKVDDLDDSTAREGERAVSGSGSSAAEFDTPAETFLDILQTTLGDTTAEVEEVSHASTDVADMADFKPTYFNASGAKTGSFLMFMREKTFAATRRILSVGTSRANIHEEGEEKLNMGTLHRLKKLLKSLRPKKKPKKVDNRPKLGPTEQQKAHFVSRTQTGSLIFLGDDFLDNNN